MQFDECKKQLWEGDVMLVMDFSTNYSHHRQGEVHGGFWCRKQTTLHPIITYYPCPQKCDQLVCDEIMLVSSDVKHDSFAVDTYVDKALSHLKENQIPVSSSLEDSSCHRRSRSPKSIGINTSISPDAEVGVLNDTNSGPIAASSSIDEQVLKGKFCTDTDSQGEISMLSGCP